MSASMKKLKAAGDRALAGQRPNDTFASYGLSLGDATLWCAAWVEELSADATMLGQDPDTREFTYRIALGMLAVGIEYGRELEAKGLTVRRA